MESESSSILSFPQPTLLPWIEAYQRTCLTHLPSGTVAVYLSILRQFTQWSVGQTKQREPFQLNRLTSELLEQYLFDLSTQGYSFYKPAHVILTAFTGELHAHSPFMHSIFLSFAIPVSHPHSRSRYL